MRGPAFGTCPPAAATKQTSPTYAVTAPGGTDLTPDLTPASAKTANETSATASDGTVSALGKTLMLGKTEGKRRRG